MDVDYCCGDHGSSAIANEEGGGMTLLWLRTVVRVYDNSDLLGGRGDQACVVSIYLVAFIGSVPIYIYGRCG